MKKRPFLILLLVGLSLLLGVFANADPRADYLIKLLSTGSSYRVRVQAAQSLGRIKCKDALPQLQKALNDSEEAVVIAAAVALAEIGDPAALPGLLSAKKQARSKVARRQIGAAIEAIGGSDGVTTNRVRRFLVKVDAMGNSSGIDRAELPEMMRKLVLDALKQQGGVVVQPAKWNAKRVRRELKKKRMQGFIISGSLVKLRHEKGFVVVNITLNVFSNPEYNLVMMPAGEIRVPSGAAVSRKEAEELAIRRLVGNLISKILEAVPSVL